LEKNLENADMDNVMYLRSHLEKLASFKQDLPNWEMSGALARKFIKYKYIE